MPQIPCINQEKEREREREKERERKERVSGGVYAKSQSSSVVLSEIVRWLAVVR